MVKSADIICDSSSLISLADSCLLPTLKTIKEHLDGSVFISPRVEHESVTRPMGIKEYSLAALRIRQAIADGTLTLIEGRRSDQETNQILEHSNRVYSIGNRPMRILHEGEAEMLALADELGIGNILMDERTTRMLSEYPEGLRKHYVKEFGKEVRVSEGDLRWFARLTKDMNIFRSSEVVVVAYELGYFKKYRGMESQMLEAALYALKFAGCGITFDEIREFTEKGRV